ncbi:MAG: biopolymer transporter ExbD [Firmicutes bacterium]|nr:biopolymer transporter ExbD [Bacillota bacterium]
MRRRQEPQINMAPLIDIVFLLLIFFIYTVNMTGQPLDINVDLPGSSTAEAGSARTAAIFLTKAGKTYLDGEAVELTSLRTLLATGDQVIIYADRGVDLQRALLVMDEVRLAGIKDVGFAVWPREEN